MKLCFKGLSSVLRELLSLKHMLFPLVHTISGVGRSAAHGNFNLHCSCVIVARLVPHDFEIGWTMGYFSDMVWWLRDKSRKKTEGDVGMVYRSEYTSSCRLITQVDIWTYINERRSTKSSRWAGNMDVFCHLPKGPLRMRVFLRLLLLLAMSKSNNAMFRTLTCCQICRTIPPRASCRWHDHLRARKVLQNDIWLWADYWSWWYSDSMYVKMVAAQGFRGTTARIGGARVIGSFDRKKLRLCWLRRLEGSVK